ncbi:hypothetical protein HMPREF3192_00212 [Atopobium deltae]|uniref:Uncharacterized protein n=1 Tax=Atopobium deltae TaxID=1393034 RepID=A0A133XXA2_9ACTN|nr:hypothetical protein HMPREF3192_00212 [Atopobium deltae]
MSCPCTGILGIRLNTIVAIDLQNTKGIDSVWIEIDRKLNDGILAIYRKSLSKLLRFYAGAASAT